MCPLLQNVAVMATGTRAAVTADADGKESRRTFNTITLEASPEEAQRVLAAREVGKVAALLRSPGDNALASSQRVDSMSLLGLASSDALPPPSSQVPVMYGGRSGSGGGRNAPALNPIPSQAAPINTFASKP
jgi:pilus assembly protein CpaB